MVSIQPKVVPAEEQKEQYPLEKALGPIPKTAPAGQQTLPL